MSYQTSSKWSPPFWLLIGARKLVVFFCHQSEARMGATVLNWSGKTLSPVALLAVFTFLHAIYFSTRLDFSSSPLSAPGSPRMRSSKTVENVPKTHILLILILSMGMHLYSAIKKIVLHEISSSSAMLCRLDK